MRTDAIKLSQKEQALLRRQAVRLRKGGKSNIEIGQILSVHAKTVGGWWAAYRREGARLFEPGKRGRRVGAQRRLTAEPNVARGYAPRGHTPVVKQMAKQFSLSMMSAVTNRGTVRFFIYKGALNVKLLVQFCHRLIASAQGRKVYLILDEQSKP